MDFSAITNFFQGLGVLDYAILIFVAMELSNVIILYFHPTFPYGNGVAVFEHWEKSKANPEVHLFARYMANWVAGVKLIFIFLLLVIVALGTEELKLGGAVAMVLSIASYFWRLSPIMKELDAMGEIKPKGYSKSLDWMIIGFMSLFSGAIVYYLWEQQFFTFF